MIVECFGPPGAGKTTLALSLTERLQANGLNALSRLSARPGEELHGGNGRNRSPSLFAAAARRLLVPATELATAVIRSPADRAVQNTTSALTSAWADGEFFRGLRMKQYLIRLANAWTAAAKSENIWVFDQAYVQAIANIMQVRPRFSDADATTMLETIPKSDLVIRIETPIDEIQTRLTRRQRKIGRIGDFFEEYSGTVVEQAATAKRLDALLSRSGRCMLTVTSRDDEALGSSVVLAEGRIRMMLGDRVWKARSRGRVDRSLEGRLTSSPSRRLHY
jgi:thymidylate kinase